MEKICLHLFVEIHNQEKEIEAFSKDLIFFFKKLLQEDLISENSLIYFIDNSSKDNSWYEIAKENVRNPNIIKGIKFEKRIKTSAIKKYVQNQRMDLKIKIKTKHNKDDILKIIKSKKQGFYDLSDNIFPIKDIFLSSKIKIKEKI